jgi:outer membrane protein TolC
MNSDDITGMALALGIPSSIASHPAVKQLVREAVANEREACEKRFMQLFLDPENQPTQFGTATQEYREQEIKAEREALEIELLKLKQGVAANSDYIQGRWDLIGEFQDIIKARGGAWTS